MCPWLRSSSFRERDRVSMAETLTLHRRTRVSMAQAITRQRTRLCGHGRIVGRRRVDPSTRARLHVDLAYPIRWVDGEDAGQVQEDGETGDVLPALEESKVGGVHLRAAAEGEKRPSALVAQAPQNRAESPRFGIDPAQSRHALMLTPRLYHSVTPKHGTRRRAIC